jgi:hypothetical protein
MLFPRVLVHIVENAVTNRAAALKGLMKLTIPSATVKSRFLKTLPFGTIYKDPRNGHSYIFDRKNNECLSKTGTTYIGSDSRIEIQVPEKYMKLDNPN